MKRVMLTVSDEDTEFLDAHTEIDKSGLFHQAVLAIKFKLEGEKQV